MKNQHSEDRRPEPLPGTWPTDSFRNEYIHPHGTPNEFPITSEESANRRSFPLVDNPNDLQQSFEEPHPRNPSQEAVLGTSESISLQRSVDETIVPSREESLDRALDTNNLKEDTDGSSISTPTNEAVYEPIKTNQSRPAIPKQPSKKLTEDEIFRTLSRRRTAQSNHAGASMSQVHTEAEEQEIQKLMSRIFGETRQAQSEDEKTRHVGVIFKNLTVKGVGLGAALQPTIGDPFLGPFRALRGLFKHPSRAARKAPVRTILNNFTGCVKPGEMLLVLGRPGAGCSTFLKLFGNQRFGYKEITGDVTYGGTSSDKIAKQYASEVLYNPEDDLHYATLTVKNTLKFALKTKTPGKASRNEGETRAQYVNEFLRVVTKLFWIEHTLGTKVGNEYVRGVSGGEKKRVSIAEAMVTRASVQAWDNSTRGLDASTALEYVEAIRTLTNMAQISTAVALYQAGESLYSLFDKVILIEEGRCLYYGPTDIAAEYFEGLGFQRPERWTTADFLTSVTDPHARQVREGWEDRIPRSAVQFEELFTKSDIQKRNLTDISEFESHLEEQRRERQNARSKATQKKKYALPFYKQVLACTQRQWLVMIGDKQSLGGKWGGILFQSLIVGSLFYNLPTTAAGA
jgi:ATP-binding cassette, subfamily G (WHITE), member 2, SNQ2